MVARAAELFAQLPRHVFPQGLGHFAHHPWTIEADAYVPVVHQLGVLAFAHGRKGRGDFVGLGVDQAEVRHQGQRQHSRVAVGIGQLVDVAGEVDVRHRAEQHVVGTLEVTGLDALDHVIDVALGRRCVGRALGQLKHPAAQDLALDVAGELAQFALLDVAAGGFHLVVARGGAGAVGVRLEVALR
ncbi:hypothetical protein D3C84_797820 [compost metagenome]